MRTSMHATWVEIAFLLLILFSFIVGVFNPLLRASIRSSIALLFIMWGLIAIVGLLNARVEHRFLLMLDSKPEEQQIGIPIAVSLLSQGGFICQNPIEARVTIEDFSPPAGVTKTTVHEAKKRFAQEYKELDVIWFGAREYPYKLGGILPKEPQAGGVSLTSEKLDSTGKIIFTLPGKQGVFIRTRRVNGKENITRIKEEDIPPSFIHVSPPEVIQEIRLGNLTYSLSLLVMALTTWQVLGELWRGSFFMRA